MRWQTLQTIAANAGIKEVKKEKVVKEIIKMNIIDAEKEFPKELKKIIIRLWNSRYKKKN